MDSITLAAVTTAVATLGMEAAKTVTSEVVKETWGKVKQWFGWTKTPPLEDLAAEIAMALSANTHAAEQIVAELKKTETGAASRLASKVVITVTNTTGPITAGGKVTVVQGKDFKPQGDMVIGGG